MLLGKGIDVSTVPGWHRKNYRMCLRKFLLRADLKTQVSAGIHPYFHRCCVQGDPEFFVGHR